MHIRGCLDYGVSASLISCAALLSAALDSRSALPWSLHATFLRQPFEQPRTIKALCVGNIYSGKSSVICRYTRNTFDQNYATTVGVDFMLKTTKTADGVDVKVQMWDIAGQERFQGLSRAFYSHASCAIVVFDILDRSSFEVTARWKRDIDDKVELPNGQKLPVLLLGNKCDLLSRPGIDSDTPPQPCATEDEINAFVKAHGFYKYYQCSALSGQNIAVAIDDLVTEAVRRSRLPPESRGGDFMPRPSELSPTVTIGGSSSSASGVPNQITPPQQSGGCC